MRATSVVASALSGLAAWFGFSNTAPIRPTKYVKIGTNPNLANTQVGTVTDKLALDPKNELSVDPAIGGFPREDELALRAFCGKESYLFQAQWQISDIPGTIVASTYVTPDAFRSEQAQTVALATYNKVQMTPMCHASSLFAYWRGPIKYRFQILCSRFHRGRLRLIYEPNGDLPVDPLLQINQVIDLATCTDFEFEVPYMAPESWKSVGKYGLTLSNLNETWGSRGTPPVGYDRSVMNGMLKLEVLSDLVAPTTTSDVTILVFVSAPDIEFAMPTPLPGPNESCYDLSPYDPYEYQAGAGDPDPMHSEEAGVAQPKMDDVRSLVYMGERLFSLRELFKRTYYSYTLPLPGPISAIAEFQYILSRLNSISQRLPRYPGAAVDAIGSNAIHTTSNGDNYNFVAFTPLSWISMCFTGIRGSVVYRVNTYMDGRAEWKRCNTVRATISNTRTRQIQDGVSTKNIVLATPAGFNSSSLINSYLQDTELSSDAVATPYGAASAVTALEPVLMASAPMYAREKFLSANPLLVSRVFGPIQQDDDNVQVTVESIGSTNGPANVPLYAVPPVHLFVSGGDDYTAFGFMGVPTIYKAASQIFVPSSS
jgi:hypothetical protein